MTNVRKIVPAECHCENNGDLCGPCQLQEVLDELKNAEDARDGLLSACALALEDWDMQEGSAARIALHNAVSEFGPPEGRKAAPSNPDKPVLELMHFSGCNEDGDGSGE